MKSNNRYIRKIISDNALNHREDVKKFIEMNVDSLPLADLSRIAELVNNGRVETSAYYTDELILDEIYKYLPEINKDEIRVLEPSVGVGNFLQPIIDKYSKAKKLIIEINDIDEKSLELLKILNKYRKIPKNVEIIYHNEDYLGQLNSFSTEKFDLVIGNPPFSKINKQSGLEIYSTLFNDEYSKNLSSFFIQKSVSLGEKVVMVMPKYFLNTLDFKHAREVVGMNKIDYILDFGEKGFQGVLIETIALVLDSTLKPDATTCISVTKKIENVIKQKKMTDSSYPSWLLYRNEFFESIAVKMKFDVFSVFRDRQLTNSKMKKSGEVRVLKSRNILRDGSGIESIKNYDCYINRNEVQKYTVGKYLNRDDVFLAPNMTYYPRVIKKPKGTLVNGSVAILEPKIGIEVTDDNLSFLCSNQFEKFYAIARNYSTRSLNIDANSVYFFGLYSK
ncbi:Eco57I restriction-modification methylase domain-containing protein [Streptococcus parauberis]|uniref:site-specific DNA-methyltransferase (adenine-specific) n=1 Tax=Streptococcus parauberis TaxID=1348 RepID=A0AAE4KUD5_9STRE|nr:Eco57I restriction-modification methylase domain-containing protein [Streptococcus parauberis]MDT2731536.1 Eco57I restriction-modification methylase domain-containing protein [Streptococcus parauberis]